MPRLIHSIRWHLAWYRKQIHRSYPPEYINVEPTNACNLCCTVCSLDRKRPSGLMKLELARAILENAKQTGVREVRFFLAGEPVLHPELPEMVKFAVDLGLHTVIHSNATRLTTEIGRKLIKTGLHELSFSFNGQNAEEYEAIHQGATFKDTLDNVIWFLEEKK
jgi:MoaA/NifB/PqqE/SkfB family radical SAM enzyme